MSESLKVDPDLLAAAQQLAGDDDINVVVADALREYIERRRKLQALLEVASKIEFSDGYGYKQSRKTRYDPA